MSDGTLLAMENRMPNEEEKDKYKDENDNIVPSYLNKTKLSVKAERQREGATRLHLNKRPSNERMSKWKVCDVDYNQWRSNVIDQRTIYNVKSKAFNEDKDPDEEEKGWAKLDDANLLPRNVQHEEERKYVQILRQKNGSPSVLNQKRFRNQILSEYKTPRGNSPSYGASNTFCKPTNRRISSFSQLLEEVTRPYSSIKIFNKRATKCEKPNLEAKQFCDVLGPIACNSCIEATNKRLARAVERATFPELDCSIESLVAPKLAKALLKGQKAIAPTVSKSQPQTAQSLPEIPHRPIMGYSYGRAGLERRYSKQRTSLPEMKNTASPFVKQPNIKPWAKVKYSFFD